MWRLFVTHSWRQSKPIGASPGSQALCSVLEILQLESLSCCVCNYYLLIWRPWEVMDSGRQEVCNSRFFVFPASVKCLTRRGAQKLLVELSNWAIVIRLPFPSPELILDHWTNAGWKQKGPRGSGRGAKINSFRKPAPAYLFKFQNSEMLHNEETCLTLAQRFPNVFDHDFQFSWSVCSSPMEAELCGTSLEKHFSTLPRTGLGTRAVQGPQVDSAVDQTKSASRLLNGGAATVGKGFGVQLDLKEQWHLSWQRGRWSIFCLPPRAAWLVSNGPDWESMSREEQYLQGHPKASFLPWQG